MSNKTNRGNFFEDFTPGQVIRHATPRTVTEGEVALYTALYGNRFVLHSSDMAAMGMGYDGMPVDDMLVFHIVFGKTVPDISLNAVANLGYADGRFGVPVYPGDTLSSSSEVIGVRENSNGKTGVVWVRTTGVNQRGDAVLSYVRWVMVRKRDETAPAPAVVVPDLPGTVDPASIAVPDGLTLDGYDAVAAGSRHFWNDYDVGEKIDHVDGMTLEESEHMLATRLYQNTAKVHIDLHAQKDGRFGKRLIYGGHIISLARSLSYNGLANAFRIAAINGGRHVAPSFAGDTVYAWSEVLDKAPVPGRDDVGALRLHLVAAKDHPCHDFPLKDGDGKDHPNVVLDFDYWAFMSVA
ncbi:MAG: MaoC family dehydratase [Rhodospirillaceae bacterium]